jgi:2-methylcitrate dehydratase PrpD
MSEPTERVVEFARTTTPPHEALVAATGQLDRFRSASKRGAGSLTATALATVGTQDDPLWTAWITGAAAAAADDPELTWVAVCAAVDALGAAEADTVAAVAVGYEVAERIAEALGPTHVAAGWAVQATAGVVGAGAAAGRVLRLDAARLRDTLGLCATQAAGLAAAHGTDAAALQLGKAAGNAVEAALLGGLGFTSAERPLEGRRGMFALMSTAADPSAVSDRLGAGWD